MKNLKAMVWCGLFAAMVLATSASAVPEFVKDHFGAGSGEKNNGYFVGEVKIAEPAGQYVYLQVQEFDGKKRVWVATQRFQARAGMKVRFRLTDPSKNFKSPTTGKVFEEIYLIPAIDVAKAETASEDCF